MRPLFIAGCPRSGTTALADYLNFHPEILVATERYNHRMHITPELFTPERLLDFRPGETSRPREHLTALLKSKRWEDLKWVGDKRPRYFLRYEELWEHNPGAHFIYIYRRAEEVTESFQERHERPNGWRFTFEDGVRLWNAGLRRTRHFVRSGAPLLIVDYHSFFSRPQEWASSLSAFLDVDFGPEIVEKWLERTEAHSKKPRPLRQRSLTKEQEAVVVREKDAAAEAWVLQRIDDQIELLESS